MIENPDQFSGEGAPVRVARMSEKELDSETFRNAAKWAQSLATVPHTILGQLHKWTATNRSFAPLRSPSVRVGY